MGEWKLLCLVVGLFEEWAARVAVSASPVAVCSRQTLQA